MQPCHWLRIMYVPNPRYTGDDPHLTAQGYNNNMAAFSTFLIAKKNRSLHTLNNLRERETVLNNESWRETLWQQIRLDKFQIDLKRHLNLPPPPAVNPRVNRLTEMFNLCNVRHFD